MRVFIHECEGCGRGFNFPVYVTLDRGDKIPEKADWKIRDLIPACPYCRMFTGWTVPVDTGTIAYGYVERWQNLFGQRPFPNAKAKSYQDWVDTVNAIGEKMSRRLDRIQQLCTKWTNWDPDSSSSLMTLKDVINIVEDDG